jgi:ADP-ribose pyrophosphatase YjhB (NUDIX family)
VSKQPQVQVTTRAMIMSRGHVLLLRAEDPGREWFFLPGGLVKHGETLAAACAREVLEETCLHVHVRRPLYLREFIAERHKRRSQHMPPAHHVLGVLFLCELNGGDADKPFDQLGKFCPDEGATGVKGMEWVSLSRVAEIEIMPPHVRECLLGDFPPSADCGIEYWPEE